MWDRGVTGSQPAEQEEQWTLMAQSGVQSVRTVFNWATAQPEAGAPFDFAATDRWVELAARRDIKVLPVVLDTPTWAALLPRESGSPPEHVSDYTAYLRALVLRYGPAGSFWDERPDVPRRPLRDWQIWNEPHISRLLEHQGPRARRLGARSTRACCAPAKRAIEAIDPGATVVLAALADFSWKHLTRLYRHGIRGHFDVAAVNLFTSRPTNVLRGLALVRGSLRKGGERRKPVWLTEVTWPAGKGRVPRPRVAWQRGWYTTDRGMARAPVELLLDWLRASAAASGSGGSSGTRGPRPTTTATCSTTPA